MGVKGSSIIEARLVCGCIIKGFFSVNCGEVEMCLGVSLFWVASGDLTLLAT